MKIKICLFICEIVMITLFPLGAMGGQDRAKAPECKEWFAKVDSSQGPSVVWLAHLPSDEEVLRAIGCLLQLHGNQSPARFSGVTHLDVSQILPQASVELAALYYISYLFSGNWQHADGIALWDRHGVVNPDGAIDIAYRAYTLWFQRVKSAELLIARTLMLNPLQGTNLSWYGN